MRLEGYTVVSLHVTRVTCHTSGVGQETETVLSKETFVYPLLRRFILCPSWLYQTSGSPKQGATVSQSDPVTLGKQTSYYYPSPVSMPVY